MKKKKCRFEVNDLLPIGFVLIVAGIGIAYGLSVLGEIKTDMIAEKAITVNCNVTSGDYSGCAADINASIDSLGAVAKLPGKMPLIATVIVAAVIIGILIRYLVVRAM